MPLTLTGSESELVRRAQEGDGRALETIARREAPRVRRLLLRLLGSRHDLDDLVQTVFLEVCRSLPRYRRESSLSTWVGGITVRVARRALRPSAWTRRRAFEEHESTAKTAGPDAELEASEQLQRLHRALAKIKVRKREAFLLWALEGLAIEEIAELTDASVSAVRSRIYHAQKELRQLAVKDPVLAELVSER